MINSLLYSVYAQARARTPARHALAILYAAAAALRAPRKLIVKQAFNTVQTGHAQRCLERNLSNKTCVASLRRPPHVTVATQRRRNMHRGLGSDAHPTTRGRSALVGTMGWCWRVVVHNGCYVFRVSARPIWCRLGPTEFRGRIGECRRL